MSKLNMLSKKIWSAASIVLLGVSVNANAELLINGGFESGFENWTTFGQGFRTSGGADANTGDVGVVNDVLPADVDVFRGVQQVVSAATAGEIYTLSAFIRGVTVDSSAAFLELQFLNSAGDVISGVQSDQVTADQEFTQISVTSQIAPTDTASIRVGGIVFATGVDVGTQTDGDFLIFDDFSLSVVPEPASMALLGVGFALMLGRKRS